MTDAISRRKLLEGFDTLIKIAQRNENDDAEYVMIVAATHVKDAPALDVAPVVRCKDCKYRFTDNCPMFFKEQTYNEDDGYDWLDHDHTSENGFCDSGCLKN